VRCGSPIEGESMNLRRYAKVTVDGERVALTVKRCGQCEGGTLVWRPVGFRSRGYLLGHLSRPYRRDRRSGLMVSGACPGNVSLSSAHGVVLYASSRMAALVRGLRLLGSD
jgi:hypothetical protein